MPERDQSPSLKFRADLLARVMPAIQAGECCSLIGISGVGKTNIARFLQRPDVQETYWPADPTWVMLIDTNGMVFGQEADDFVVLELMIQRLIREAEQRHFAPAILRELSDLQATLIAQPSARLALRYLERICARCIDIAQTRLVFVFDQFEDIWRKLDARLFLNLRYLRDEFKYRLSYLVMTRTPLTLLREDLAAVESFSELFSSHLYGLGMYNQADSSETMERIARRRHVKLTPELQERGFLLSGGHPALLRALFWRLLESPDSFEEGVDLAADPQIAQECAKIWQDLSSAEQQIARMLAGGAQLGPEHSATSATMRLKGLLTDTPPRLFAPIFSAYVEAQLSGPSSGVVIDTKQRRVWVNGQPLSSVLSPLEFTLLEYLARHSEKVCRREAILQALYHDQAIDTNDERLDTLLRRLREALGDDAKNPQHLFTHRGVGIRLANGRILE